MREIFGVGNFAVTCIAVIGRARGVWVVRFVARHARLARIVNLRYDLRKTRRSGGIVPMAERAVAPTSGGIREEFIRSLDVVGCRTMAGFAGYTGMP